jgi:hypothetical protein
VVYHSDFASALCPVTTFIVLAQISSGFDCSVQSGIYRETPGGKSSFEKKIIMPVFSILQVRIQGNRDQDGFMFLLTGMFASFDHQFDEPLHMGVSA